MEAILELCREAGLHGVSVIRGIEGLGKHGIHSASFLALSNDLPLLIEAIDTTECVEHAIEQMRPHLGQCLVAVWPVSLMNSGGKT
jgi:PII-like signaling protein